MSSATACPWCGSSGAPVAEQPEVRIGDRVLTQHGPVYVIAEISANHGGDLGRAIEIVHAAADAGADAVKLQTYTAETMTIHSNEPPFIVKGSTPWTGRNLYELYQEAFTPWEWHGPLKDAATEAGIDLFSTAFDASAVDYLEDLGVLVHKIASFEITDLALVERAAGTGKPLIISTGMATADEIDDAVRVARSAGADGVVLLRCNSAYPAPPEDMDLATIPHMAERWSAPVGLSDHTLGPAAAVVATAFGACALEKHITLRRDDGGPDSMFSLEPDELRETVRLVRDAREAVGGVRLHPTEREQSSLAFRRSVFVVRDIAAGEVLTRENVRVIRPADGLPPSALSEVIGRVAARDLTVGTPLAWEDLSPR